VGTGLEEKVARDSGAVVIARRGGVVTRVTADEIIIDSGDEDAPATATAAGIIRWRGSSQHDRFRLKKFWRTNQDTAINQRPLVQMGQKVKAGQIVADGAGTERGISRSAPTSPWRSCRGTATTSKTRSCSPSAS